MGVRDFLKKQASRFVDARLGDEYAEKSKALTVRQNEFGFDPFGFSREHIKYAIWLARFLYRDYFRAEVSGIENVPAAGRVLLVANHSGQIPFERLLSQLPFDAVVSDFDLSEASTGAELLAEVRDLWPETRRVLFSGSDSKAMSEYVRAGVAHCLVCKPSGTDELLAAIDRNEFVEV